VTGYALAWQQARTARPERKPRRPLLLALVGWLAARLPAWSKVRTAAMQITAFGFLDYAAWQWSTIAGCVAVGVSLLILEALGGGDRR
jgi:hypothetical protein